MEQFVIKKPVRRSVVDLIHRPTHCDRNLFGPNFNEDPMKLLGHRPQSAIKNHTTAFALLIAAVLVGSLVCGSEIGDGLPQEIIQIRPEQ